MSSIFQLSRLGSFNFFRRSPPERPAGLIIPDEQIERARAFFSQDFTSFPGNPFASEAYRAIGYPWSFGYVPDRENIEAGIASFMEMCRQEGYTSPFGRVGAAINDTVYAKRGKLEGPLLSRFRFLTPWFERDVARNYFIYRHDNVKVFYSIHIDQVEAGETQRPGPEAGAATTDFWHTDVDWANEKNYLEKPAIKSRERYGVSTISTFASRYTTRFRSMIFDDWEESHFVGEEHLSPVILSSCVRCFCRSTIHPVLKS